MNIISNDHFKLLTAVNNLYNVIDPEIGLNIVDLGLVYQIDFVDDEQKIEATMTLTTQFCPMGDSITSDTKQALSEAFPGWEINLELTFEPPWDYSKISPEGQEFLSL